jgi:hypothetical protein
MIEGIHTTQDLFDHVVRHLFKQHAKSARTDLNGSIRCKYRGAEGRKCAIGCVIDDSIYKPFMEDEDVHALSGHISKSIGRELTNSDIDVLDDLRYVHDTNMVHEWPTRLKWRAKMHGLSFNFIYLDGIECLKRHHD